MSDGRAKVAVVGAGISGLAAAHALRDDAQVTLFEAADYFGGHAHTVDITLPRSPTDATARSHHAVESPPRALEPKSMAAYTR